MRHIIQVCNVQWSKVPFKFGWLKPFLSSTLSFSQIIACLHLPGLSVLLKVKTLWAQVLEKLFTQCFIFYTVAMALGTLEVVSTFLTGYTFMIIH